MATERANIARDKKAELQGVTPPPTLAELGLSRWALVEGYWNLGKRISEENDNFEREKIYGNKIVSQVTESLQISELFGEQFNVSIL
ncbi:MAG: hypothetical protein JRJ77_12130 [Deltaproteobacteria bacterium]|nr:hypothetical protein [Deltaproteobacteria bacterium]